MPVRSLIALHLAVALFGVAGLFGKWLTLPPVTIVLARTAIAALVLALIVALQRDPLRVPRALVGNGIVLALHWITFFQAIQVSTVAIGLLGYATFPLFVLLLEAAMLRRRPGRSDALTVLLVVIGLLVLVPAFDLGDRTVRGLAWGLGSGFTFALLTVRSRALAATQPAATIAFGQNLVAALVLVPVAWFAGATFAAVSQRDIALLLALGVVCTALAHTLFIASLKRVTAHAASVVAALEPVYGIALAALLLDEIPTARTLAGAALILVAALRASHRAASV